MEKPANLSNRVLQCIQKRRSCRKFTAQAVEDYKVESLLKAALWAPTSKNNRPWHFVVVDNPQLLGKLSECKPHGSAFLAEAPLAIVVLADPSKSDVWVEDCAIAAILMQITAEDLGLGSTWIQIRQRLHNEKESAGDYVKNLLKAPAGFEVASIIALGYKEKERAPYSEEYLLPERVHRNKF